jgi:predicted amidophosphoribosyltransferase
MHGRRHRTPETVVTLLDDVMTTGETLAAACRVLQRAGLSRIEVVTLMRRG